LHILEEFLASMSYVFGGMTLLIAAITPWIRKLISAAAIAACKEYDALAEGRVLRRVRETIPVIRQHKGAGGFTFADPFKMLNTAIDFTEFRTLTVSYKQERQRSRLPHTQSGTEDGSIRN
jgi:hypothetical protein